MKRNFKIVTDIYVRDPRAERRIIEYNRELVLYYLILAGAVLILLGVVW